MSVRLVELTASGSGGVSIIAALGEGAFEFLESWGVPDLKEGELRFARLRLEGEVIDEALVCARARDCVEVHVHGSQPLVKALLARLQFVEEAERSLEDRAQELLTQTTSDLAARILLDQVEGALRRELEAWPSLSETEREARLDELLARSYSARFLFAPARVLLMGPVNAGKSTLFNLLVGGERVITSAEEGTTRDLIQERAELGGWPLLLCDSAGLRDLDVADPGTFVERAGFSAAQRAALEADLILWLRPPGAPPAPKVSECAAIRELASFSDLEGGSADGISALHEPQAALERVLAVVCEALGLPSSPWTAGLAVLFDRRDCEALACWKGLDSKLLSETIAVWLATSR
ncbi:MAG: tRNA U34 5-carboxymethylaminomethyl modifying GTPase MnmE/TrmE [Planctomycetota bacterium]|jgi:tRNA U34 5-carboxymethylaminomethyl modifying GTPase MnmE/TrmE